MKEEGGVKGEKAGGSKEVGAWGGEGAASGGEESSLAKCDGFIAAAGLMKTVRSENSCPS